MSPRIALVLVVMLVVLGGGALLFQQQERSRRPDNAASLGQVLLKDLKAADIATVKITETRVSQQATLTLQRQEAGWVIAERDNFPADVSKVREFALKLLGLKVGQSEPIGEKDRARLELDASGTKVDLLGADGKTLASLIVGKKVFKREVENPDKALGDGRFVMLPADPKTVLTVSDPLLLATARTAEWIDRASFQVEKIAALEVKYPDGGAWRIERKGDNAGWKLGGIAAGEKLDISRANAASYSLSLLSLADVAAKDAKNTGLDAAGPDRPTLINATTLEGRAYAIKVGRLQGDNYFVSFASAKPKDKEALLSKQVLLIPKSKLEDTLKKRADLLEAKAARKK